MFDDVAVYNQMVVNPAQMPHMINDACKAALVHRGVAHINLPIDISIKKIKKPGKIFTFGHERPVLPTNDQLEVAANIINQSTKVVFLVGDGARGGRNDLFKLAKKLQAPLVNSLRGKDVILDHPHAVGGL